MLQDKEGMPTVAARAGRLSPHQQTVEAAEAKLRRSLYAELRRVECEVREGILTLRGRLPSYYLKQVAQCLVEGVPGVVAVSNHVEVVATRGFRRPGRTAPDFPEATQRRPR